MNFKMLKAEGNLGPKCYNKYFLLYEDNKYENNKYFWVDGGNGTGLISQFNENNINWKDINDIFLNHKDIDHINGVIWMIRMIGQAMDKGHYKGEARIYAHESLIEIIENITATLLDEKDTKFIGNRIHLIKIKTGESYTVIGNKTTFFDVNSSKDIKLGFTMNLKNGEKFTFMQNTNIAD